MSITSPDLGVGLVGPDGFRGDAIPAELRAHDQWICWRYGERDGKRTKFPISPITGEIVSVVDSTHWATLEAAIEAWRGDRRLSGIGFVFTADDPFTGIDIDDCLDDVGKLIPAAGELVAELDSYTETSPSGRGVKVFVAAAKPPHVGSRSKAIPGVREVEVYSSGRFFTVTGRHYAGTPEGVEDRQAELDALCGRLWPQEPTVTTYPPHRDASVAASRCDEWVIERACAAANGDRFRRLWKGDTTLHEGDDSAADLSLCSMLAFWTGRDEAQMDRLFRRSGLMRPKWDQARGATTYGRMTISRAIESCVEVYSPRLRGNAESTESESSGREILLDVDEHRVIDEAEEALANDHDLFVRGGALVRVIRIASQKARVRRSEGSVVIAAAPPAHLRERLTRVATFLRHAKDGPVPAHPPGWLVGGLGARGEWPKMRDLVGVSESPFLRPDGSLCQQPGYDPSTGVLLTPSEPFPPISNAPSRTDALESLVMLDEVIADFRFESPVHRAAWLASLLTPLARHAFEGPAPLFLVDANVRGAGKGLLCQTIGEIVLGRPMPVTSYSSDTEEMRKKITTIALAGDTLVLLDNLEGKFGNDALDRALTATHWRDRVLGTNDQAELPLHAVWYATGNNVQVGADTMRRIIHIRLDVLEERPEDRSDFSHPNLLAWVRSQRFRLLAAALTILAAYCKAGRPAQGLTPMGSFEGWSSLVREAVVWLGLPDPCSGRERLLEFADTAVDTLSMIINALEVCGAATEGVVIGELVARLYPADRTGAPTDPASVEARQALEQLTGASVGRPPTGRAISNKLKVYRRRVVSGRYLDIDPNAPRRAGATWRVYAAEPEPVAVSS